jgi:hypothetical protein
MKRLVGLLFFSSNLSAMYFGNPAQPGLLTKGIAVQYDLCSFRFGYLDDWIYEQKFQNEFILADAATGHSTIELSTYAGLLTLNFVNRVDIYGIIGSSRMQVNEEIFTKRELGWGIGVKWLIFQEKNFFIGADAKYFHTYQKPSYFIFEGAPLNNVLSSYRLYYSDVQVAVGIAYKAVPFCPYINGTYVTTKITPQPATTLVRLPEGGEITDLTTSSLISLNNFGIAAGMTLLDSEKASLSCEWRGINQSGVNVNLEVRF